jgi:hypothetical protein
VGYRHRLHDQGPQSSSCIFRMPSGCLQVALRSTAQASPMSQVGVDRQTLAVLFSGASQRVIDDRTGTSDRGSNDHP